jgi:ribonuclease E
MEFRFARVVTMKPRNEAPQLRDSGWDEGAGAPKPGASGVKLVLIGALAPVILAGAVVSGMLALGSSREETAGLKPEAALDCSSPRNSWRWACQQAKSAEEGYGITVAAPSEGPATTGSVERPATARSSTAKGADGEPVRGAAAGGAPSASAAVAEKAEPAKAASAPTSPAASAWVEPAPDKPARPIETKVMPAKPAQNTETANAAAATAAPVRPEAKTETAARVTPVAEPEPAIARAAARVTEPPRPAASERSDRRKTVAAAEDEPAPRLSRKRSKSREAATRETVAPRKAAPRKETASRAVAKRAQVARTEGRERAASPEVSGYRVMSLRTYTLPDGRRVVVQSAPRQDVVRELLAEHQATFGRRQFASPY